VNYRAIVQRNSSFRRWVCFFLPLLLLTGCERDEVNVYYAPKDELPPPPQMAANDNPHAGMASHSHAQLTWKLPAGWKQVDANNGVTFAAFTAPGKKGEDVEVGIAQLSDLTGREAILVNMWRESVGLQPLNADESLKELSPVKVGDQEGSMFKVAGTSKDGHPLELITAMENRPQGTLFYRLAGDPDSVEAQKDAFMDFLKSIRIQPGEVTTAPPADEAAAQQFNWTVPANWTVEAPGQMQVARFAVPGKAEVFVSVFPSDTGGTLANVNRWRRQLHLPEITEADLASVIAPLDPANSRATLVDMTNNGQQLLGATVPRDGRYWFYKLLGDSSSVAPQKDAFIAFAKSKP
jgi:hypothetical protein